MQLYLLVPLFLVHALKRYGDLQYQAGSSLSYYRHLLLEAQRRVPNAKQFMSVAWDYATRWQNQEPTVHRQPLPMPILKAMVSLAWMLGWRRWVGVTLLAFFGIGRVGEVIRCTRKQLLLPSDILDSDCKDAFLVLYVSKTMFRQPARIQHMKVTDQYVVRLLTIIFSDFDRNVLLYYGGAGVYGRRWDYLLKLLKSPPWCRSDTRWYSWRRSSSRLQMQFRPAVTYVAYENQTRCNSGSIPTRDCSPVCHVGATSESHTVCEGGV